MESGGSCFPLFLHSQFGPGAEPVNSSPETQCLELRGGSPAAEGRSLGNASTRREGAKVARCARAQPLGARGSGAVVHHPEAPPFRVGRISSSQPQHGVPRQTTIAEWVQHPRRDAPTVCLAPSQIHVRARILPSRGGMLAPGGVIPQASSPGCWAMRPVAQVHVPALLQSSRVTLDKWLPLSEVTVPVSVCLAHSRHSIHLCLLALWAPVTYQRRGLGPKSLLFLCYLHCQPVLGSPPLGSLPHWGSLP